MKKRIKPKLTPQQVALRKIEQYGTPIVKKPTWKKIPFAHGEYWITPEGKVYSDVYEDLRELTQHPSNYKVNNLCVNFPIKYGGNSGHHQIARLVYFCFNYPEVIRKPLEQMTEMDYRKMPVIKYKDGNDRNVSPKNLTTGYGNVNQEDIIKLVLKGIPTKVILERLNLKISKQGFNDLLSKSSLVYDRSTKTWKKLGAGTG